MSIKQRTNHKLNPDHSPDLSKFQYLHGHHKRTSDLSMLKGVNISTMAVKCGINRSSLSRVLHGKNKPGIGMLERLKVALEMDSVESVMRWLQRIRVKTRQAD